ncbi:MAG: malectin domain-containing carbohydrate-binding protein, partial [Candidatus Acidiferrales bacterium]
MLFAQPVPSKLFHRTSAGFDSAKHSAREFANSPFFRQASLLSLAFLAFSFTSGAQTSMLTQHNNTMRTGLNPNETILTTSNVNESQFGKLFALPVDGQVYAQPLYVPHVSIAGGTHNVLIVATEADSVYAFDADSNSGANAGLLWKASLVDAAHGAAAGETPLNSATTIGCTDIQPQIGITSTPVIDPIAGTIYVEAKSVNGSTYIHRLHALDLASGNEKSPGPTVITATVNGTGDGSSNGKLTFDSLHQMNRSGLLLLNGAVYVAFASHCDYSPYHGWLYAYDATSLAQKSVFVSDPNGGLGGFWMAGAGVAADANSNIYIASGNGTFDTVNVPATNLGDSIIKLGTTNANLSLLDYFTPYDQASLDSGDRDLGSGGVMLLPDQPGTYPHVLVQSGKEGRIFVINRDQMTSNNRHYCTTNCNGGDPQILEESSTGFVGGMWSMPAYWNNTLYFWGNSDSLKAIPVTNGLPDFTHITGSTQTISFPGETPAISSNGTASGTAILWAIDSSQYGSPGPGPGPAVLYAYDATNLSKPLWTSAQAPNDRDWAGNAVKFAVPTIVNGKVYIGTSFEVDVYGLLTQLLPTPQIIPGSETFTGSVSVSISDTNSAGTIYYTTDGSTPTPGAGTTQVYNAPFNVAATTTVQAIAVATGYANSPVAAATYTLQTKTTGPSIRVRAGTTTSYTDPSGNVWTGDADYSGGTEATITHAIANTTTQPLYQTERYNEFTYTFTGLPAGLPYVVTLKFSEDYWTAAGKRIFNVILNGTTVLSNFDIFADSGGEYIADDKTFNTTVNSSGQIVIQFE